MDRLMHNIAPPLICSVVDFQTWLNETSTKESYVVLDRREAPYRKQEICHGLTRRRLNRIRSRFRYNESRARWEEKGRGDAWVRLVEDRNIYSLLLRTQRRLHRETRPIRGDHMARMLATNYKIRREHCREACRLWEKNGLGDISAADNASWAGAMKLSRYLGSRADHGLSLQPPCFERDCCHIIRDSRGEARYLCRRYVRSEV